MDELLRGLHRAASVGCARDQSGQPRILLAAAGGYGRRLLGWKSDLDLRFLTPAEPERVTPLAEAILYPLWDAGVSVGHQVVTIPALMADAVHDLPTATVLLDVRPISGDTSLASLLKQRAFASVFERARLPDFLRRLEAEASARHERFRDSAFLLEPDVKNGVGGLRDLDLALWAAGACFQASELDALCRLSVLATGEAEEIGLAMEFLWTVRNRLHRHAARKADRLTFYEQEQIAGELGYRAGIGLRAGATDARIASVIAEAFMRDYRRHTRVITQAYEQILACAMPRFVQGRGHEVDLGQGFSLSEGAITMADPALLRPDPVLSLRLFAIAVARELPILPAARAAIARATREPAFGAALRAAREASSLFLALVTNCKRTRFSSGSILNELHAVGLLTAMIPEFSALAGRAPHDVFHVYTVDVHSILAVDHLRALVRGELDDQQPLAARLAMEVTRREELFMATLLHDVGKAVDGRGHARRGADTARAVLNRLGLAPDEVEEACQLIVQHLAMSLVAMRRDVDDPLTISEFARTVRGRPGLRGLYMLTIADMSTNSSSSMSQWKVGMLDRLFTGCDSLLAGSVPVTNGPPARVREEVARCDRTLDQEFLAEFLDTMPARYRLSTTPTEIAAHARVAFGVRHTTVSAAFVPSRNAELAELCVVTEGGLADARGLRVLTIDRPGLLAAMTAAIGANRLDVHAAQVYSRPLAEGGFQAVDLFWVRDRIEGVAGVERILPKLNRDLSDVITGRVSPRELLRPRRSSRWSERSSPTVFNEIVIDHEVSPQHTVVEVLTKDQPWVLFTLAEALHRLGLTIALARINTEGTRVSDVFYVAEAGGGKIDPGPRAVEVRAGLLAALNSLTNTAVAEHPRP